MASPNNSFPEENGVACPYFMPIAKLENGSWPHPGRLPLGCGWSGRCTAPGHEQAIPSQDVLEKCCNLGYVDGCGWAPAERPWDAVRFAITSRARLPQVSNPPSGENARSRILRLIYVYEQSNRPAGHGELQFDIVSTTWLRRHEDDRIQKMAECFLESYLGKKS